MRNAALFLLPLDKGAQGVNAWRHRRSGARAGVWRLVLGAVEFGEGVPVQGGTFPQDVVARGGRDGRKSSGEPAIDSRRARGGAVTLSGGPCGGGGRGRARELRGEVAHPGEGFLTQEETPGMVLQGDVELTMVAFMADASGGGG